MTAGSITGGGLAATGLSIALPIIAVVLIGGAALVARIRRRD
jgi:hypothetical protein